MKKYRIRDNEGFAGAFGWLVEVFAMFLEYGCILFEYVINIHSGSSSDTSQENDQICILKGLFLTVGIVDLYIGNISVTAVLEL